MTETKKKKKPWTKAPISRAVTGGVSCVAFVAVTAAMGPIFPAEAEAAAEIPVATPSMTTLPDPVLPSSELPPPASTAQPAPLPPTTIIVTIRREVLVGSGSPGGTPTPRPVTGSPSSSPSPAPAAPAAPPTTAAPAPPAPPPPPPPAAAPPLSSGS